MRTPFDIEYISATDLHYCHTAGKFVDLRKSRTQCAAEQGCDRSQYCDLYLERVIKNATDKGAVRDHAAEARALPHHEFDLLMHAYLWKAFQPWIDGVSALELGCFHGAMSARIYETFPDTTIVEASAECIEATAKRLTRKAMTMRFGPPLVEFIHSTFEAAQIDRQFDAIFLTHTLEHVDDPVALLKRCKEWLEPEGRLFLAVPNAYAASRQIAVHMGIVEKPEAVTAAEHEHGHRRTYSLASLLDHVAAAGFENIPAMGGVLFKPLANFQMDKALAAGIIDEKYLDACYELGKTYPEMCASVYMVCSR